MLFTKTGNKYLHKIDSVEILRKSDFEGEYWPYIHDEVAYIHDRSGYHTTDISRIVEADKTEVVPLFGGSCYKWRNQ